MPTPTPTRWPVRGDYAYLAGNLYQVQRVEPYGAAVLICKDETRAGQTMRLDRSRLRWNQRLLRWELPGGG